MKIELDLRELQEIATWAPQRTIHPSTQALTRKIRNIVAAAESREGEKYIEKEVLV